MVEPGWSTTVCPATFTIFAGNPLTVISFPAGSIHDLPSGLTPYGITSAFPVAGSTAETEATLPASSWTWLVTGPF